MAYTINLQDLRLLPHNTINTQDKMRLLTFGFFDPPLAPPANQHHAKLAAIVDETSLKAERGPI